MNFSFVQFAVASLYYRPDVSLVRGHGIWGVGKVVTKTNILSISSLGGGDKNGLTWAGAKKRCKVPFRDPRTGRTKYVYTKC